MATGNTRRNRSRYRKRNGGQSLGPSIDATGTPVIDPTENVLALVTAAIQRQDDLREQDTSHIKEILAVHAGYQEKLARQEAARIDAIRAVDVAAVSRAAEVAATQAGVLATQLNAAAEAMRNQVAAAATAAQTNLTAALEPIQTSISDLRRVQYEQQGQRSAQSEGKDTSQWLVGLIAALASGIIVALMVHYMK